MKDIDKVLKGAIDKIRTEHPDVFAVMERAKGGELTEEEAMLEMLRLTRDSADSIVGAIGEALTPLHEPGSEPVATLSFNSGVGLPQMNPLVEAALAERIQFDGDAPELRSGPMINGVMPAVPVDTTARNGAVIGLLLRAASEQMAEKLRGHDEQRLLAIGGVDEEGALMIPPDKAEALVWGKQGTDLAGYRRGEEPAPVAIQKPSGATLAALTPEQQRQGTWRFLSTTQGRRSALATLSQIIKTNLTTAGLDIEARTPTTDPAVQVISFHEWVMTMGGENNTQPGLAVIDTAAICLYKGLIRGLGDGPAPGQALWLEVLAVNTVDVREIGWSARLIPR